MNPSSSLPAPTPRKRRRWLFVVGGIAALLIGVPALFFAFLWFYDEPFPDDADLLAPNSVAAADFVPIFPTEETAKRQNPPRPEPTSNDAREHLLYFGDVVIDPNIIPLSEIKKSLVSSEKEFDALREDAIAHGVNEKNIAVAREILEANNKAQEVAQKILRNPDLRTPPLQNPIFPALFPEVSALRDFGTLTSLQVQVLQFEGKPNEAFLLEKGLLDFLHRIPVSNREECLVTGLSQIIVLKLNIPKTLPVLFSHLNKEQCDSLASILLKIENSWNADSFKMILRTEYTITRNSLKNNTLNKNAGEGLSFPQFPLKPNWLLRRIGKIYRTTIQALNDDTVLLPDLWNKWDLFLDLLLDPTGTGAMEIVPSMEATYRRVLEHRAQLRAARVALAARAYSLGNAGKLPPELGALVPKYLPVLPTDPFSQEKAPLRYDAKQGLIWSIGENFKDEGGEGYFTPKSGKRNRDADDIAFQIPVGAGR
jgi:hypothetical protein